MSYTVALPDGRTVEFPDDVPRDKAAAIIRQQFPDLGAPETTILGGAKELFKGLVPGAVGLVESAATGASALLPEDMEKAAREKIASVAASAKEPFKAAAGYEESIPRKLSEAIGSTIPFLAAGPLGLAGRAAAVGLGVGAGAGEARTRAEAEGATTDQRGTATALGILPGAAEAFAPFRILARIPEGATASAVQMVKRAFAAGGEEAAQEVASGLAQNMIAKGIYKPEQALVEGLGEQAAYGGATGAIIQGLMDVALGRRAKGAAPAPTPRAEPGPQVAPEAPVGTQGALFTGEKATKPAEAAAPVAETYADLTAERDRLQAQEQTPEIRAELDAIKAKLTGPVSEKQLDLGIDFQRDYADLLKERTKLTQQPQTPEVKARVNELTDQIMSLHENEVESIRAEKAQEAETRDMFPGLTAEPAQQGLFPELDVVRPDTAIPEPIRRLTREQEEARRRLEESDAQAAADVAQKLQERKGGQYRLPLRSVPEGKNVRRDLPIPARPTEITMQDLEDIGVPMRTSQKWLEQNVIGKTPAEIQVLVGNNPDLLLGTGARAQILKYLTAPVPEGFVEEPNVAPITQTNKPKPVNQPRRSQPSVGVSGQPTVPNVVQPGAGVPTTAGAPATPDGRGLAPAGQPAGKGTPPKAAQPTAVTPNAPTPAAPTPSPAAPAAPAEKPAVAAKPTPKAPVAKKVEAPAPAKPAEAVETETAEEEAARKAEADEIKRRLEEVERKLQERPAQKAAAPTPEPKAEKPAPKELPDKLREPIGTSEFGMEEGEKEIQRGPQGLLFPMSKREELEYAERKERDIKAGAEAPTKAQMVPRDSRQGRLDLQERKEAPAPKAAEIPKWAVDNTAPGFTPVYGDEDIALYRAINVFGTQVYIGVNKARNGYYTNKDIESYTGKDFTPEQRETLLAARSKAVFDESKRASKYPDGPFTGATTNVVKSDSVDQRYADYLRELMSSMGLGNVRIFLLHPDDMRQPGAQDKYRLYKSFETAQTAGFKAGEEGSTQNMGPYKRDFYISFKPGMSENKSLEVISHELGHTIESIAYKNAPQETKDAIKAEYEKWLASTKGKTGRELVQMLRNRETADTQMLTVDEGKTAAQMDPYWTLFSEWFADNTSRWASTAEKPVSIVEKFFSKVAQMMRDLVAVVTGRKYPPNKKVAEFLDAMGPGSADLWVSGQDSAAQPSTKASFSKSYTPQDVVNSMGPLTPVDERGLKEMIVGAQKEGDPTRGVKFRVAAVDSAAAIEEKFSRTFNGAVRDNMGKLNPMGLYRQAQDYSKILLEYFQNGTLTKDKTTGLYRAIGTAAGAPSDVFPMIYAWGEKTGRTKEQAEQYASRVLEAKRLDEVLKINPDFPKHINDRDRAILVAEYNSDPVYAKFNAAMDKPRIALIEKMVEVGRLSKEKAEEWKSVVGYVPFDRIDDFSEKFSMTKKTTGRSPLALTKDPELVGSFKRPVGNVFENYLNTMGWMVGQVMNNDARVQTLRGLEDLGFTGKASRVPGTEGKTAKAFINGEAMYWELPSRYDVAAFQDLNPPKMAIMRTLGAFSNILRKSVTILPPFALKQVTDDVQRAMLTSGVKNPGALLRMSLANFGKLAVAELRGIQHPIVKEFGALGLTGEYDFQQGKPAVSLLQDLGYRQREALGSKTLGTILHRLDGITRASDLAVRKAIYEQTLKESNNDMLLAQSRAREFINFRRRGASETIAIATATIPFFNAYVQGMDVLYRAASGKDSSSSVGRAQARQLFWSRAGTVAALSTMYALMAGDDEDYQDMDLRTRNGNWILPGGYKIPVPGELGAIFKVIPETVVEYLRRSGTPEEQTALEAIRASAKYMAEQYIERTVPIPQAVKPLIEAWTNYSFFTGRELEGIYQKQQDPSMRTTSKTSELAQAISNFSRDVIGVDAVSPIQIDNMLSGYFGSTAALVTMMTDSLLNPSRVDRPLHKYALLSNYMYDPVGTRSLTEFYDEREKVGKANNTLRQLMKTDIARAESYAMEHQQELMLESSINSTLEQLERTRAYRKFLNSPDGAAEMSKADREKELEEIKKMEVEFTRWLREAKTEIRKVQ